jgi:dihydrolipoamide dehydrogenase
MDKRQIIVIAALLIVAALFFFFDLHQLLTLETIKAEQGALSDSVHASPLVASLLFLLFYITITAVSLPGAAIMTLAAGAVFGFWWGLVMVSFASTIGATLAMLVARFVLRAQVEKRFAQQIAAINQGIDREGAFYLFTLRLVPIVPFFVINLAMGLTSIRPRTFYLVSQLGMLAGTVVYVNAGTQLAGIESASDILSPGLLLAFVLLGLFPLVAKRIVDLVRSRKVYQGYQRPTEFDRDAVVIGAGSGGLVAALIVATVRGSVTLIEKNKMGGDCLNTGCVPSKALIRSAKLAADMKRGASLGFSPMVPDFDFADIMQRVQRVIGEIEPHDSVERYESLGVNVEIGNAEILTPWTVRVNGEVLSTRSIIIATGAEPFVPPVDGIDQVSYLTSDTIWSMRELPERLAVMGGGPIGTELTQTFARLGSKVTQIEQTDRIMTREDPEISAMVASSLGGEGVNILTGHRAVAVTDADGEKSVRCVAANGDETVVPFDQLLVAVGRRANVEGLGLENLGVVLTDRGTIAVDDYLRTNFPNIYAIGDVAGPYQFTHTASHMAWYAAVNALFGTFWNFKVDYSVVPWCTFSSPEVARVGISESEAKAQGIAVEVTRFDVGELDRAIADEEAHGVVKVLTVPGKDRILGVTIVADHAGDLISEYVLAMKHGLGLKKIMGTIHIYPTLAEMNKFAASEWRKNHKPDWALALVEKYHNYRRTGHLSANRLTTRST